MKKICKICGKEFEAKSSRRSFCYDDHYHRCPVCGKAVLTKDLQHLNSCCSSKCSRMLATYTIHDRFEVWPSSSGSAEEKRLSTVRQRYGCDNVMHVDAIRKKSIDNAKSAYSERKEEIEDKKKQTSLSRFGTAHPMQSDEVKQRLSDTNLSKYGVASTLSLQVVKDKIASTNLERYGVSNPLQSNAIKDKVKCTNLQRHGSETYAGSSDHRAKFEHTMMERYGTLYPTQVPEFADKVSKSLKEYWSDDDRKSTTHARMQETISERYGPDGLASAELQDKRIYTSVERYGVPHYSETDEFKERVKSTSLKRYGTTNAMQNAEVKNRFVQSMVDKHGVMWPSQKSMTDKSKYQELLKYRENIEEYISKIPFEERTEFYIASLVGVTPSVISDDVVKHNLQHLIRYTKSNMEDELFNFLKDLLSDCTIIRNCRTAIAPYELDLYIPDLNIAFECNGTYAHNSSEACYGNDPKSYSYHKMKTELCENAGIFLMHIYSYQWKFNKEIIESRIRNCVHKNENRIFARNLTVKDVSYSDSIEFLNRNHIQGSTSSRIRIGLYQGDELVSIMTFSKPRGLMGNKTKAENFDWELTRFCSKLNTTVVGGASKLFKHFLSTYQPQSVSSFSSRDCTTGGVYSKLGFHIDGYTDPGYVWVDSKTDRAYNRSNCQKSNLIKLLNDDSIDVVNQSESQIMRSHGFVQVFNSGLIRWVWRANL